MGTTSRQRRPGSGQQNKDRQPWCAVNQKIGPVRLTLKLACSASFFSAGTVFFSHNNSDNNIFQPVLAKFQQAKWGHRLI